MLKRIFIILITFINYPLKAQIPPTPILNPGEHWTNLWSVSYDFQSNGSIRYLVQNPENPNSWCAVFMAQQDSNSALGIQRFIYCAYSSNNGDSWSANQLNLSTSSQGFPSITLKDGSPLVAFHKGNTGSCAFRDSAFGTNNFSQIGSNTSASNLWPVISVTTNGNLVMTGALSDFSYIGARTTYNGISWLSYSSMPLISGGSGNFDVFSGSGGKVAIVGTDFYNATYKMYWYRSIDNGLSFDNGSLILPFVVDGSDTLFANYVGGYRAWYDQSGNAHVIFTAYNYNEDVVFANFYRTLYIKPGIFHWSSQNNIVTRVAGKVNIPTLSDTITQIAKAPLCQPTVSITAGGKLICAYTTYLENNKQIVRNGDTVNSGDIFYNVSNDNGLTWSTPQNLTNTPDIEEKHPSLVLHSATDSLRIFYVRDMMSGDCVQNYGWGIAPVYGIFNNQHFNTVPSVPLLIAPVNNSNFISLTPLLDWNNTPGADSYKLQLSRNADFTDLLINQSALTISQFEIPNSILNYDSVYYWRVNASNSIGTGDWSAIWNFRTRNIFPPPPVLVSPANNSLGVSLTPFLRWSNSPTAQSYNVQVSNDSNFKTLLINQTGITAVQYRIPSSVLSMNTEYYWKVNATNKNGNGLWSAIWKFKTLLVNIGSNGEVLPEDYYLGNNYPNPFNPVTRIKYELPGDGYVSIKIYDNNGKEMKTIVNESKSAGYYSILFDGSNLSSGIYFYRIIVDSYLANENFTDVKKMILIK